MKQKIIDVTNKSKVNEILVAVGEAINNSAGAREILIRNKPVTFQHKRYRIERAWCSQIAQQTGKDKDKVHYFNKSKFLVPILMNEDRAFKKMTKLIRQDINAGNSNNSIVKAFIHTFVRMDSITKEGGELFLKNVKEYWEDKGVELGLGNNTFWIGG